MQTPTDTLRVENISAHFDNLAGPLQALAQIDFVVPERQFLCVLGPSGSGKSTLLRILGGLMPPSGGQILFDGRPLTGPTRKIGYVFQNPHLMPWRTVRENILLPLDVQKLSRQHTEQQVADLVDLIGLQGFENWLPGDLSGGMAQRVAIARALIYAPQVLLLDEPFAGLDALTRERMGLALMRVWEARQTTVVMVTHSISEAIYLADRVLVLSSRPGKICLDLPIHLTRPRKESVQYSPEFNALAQALRRAIAA